MRLNKYLASSTDLSRRNADVAISSGRVSVNGLTASQGQDVLDSDVVELDGRKITQRNKTSAVMLHKPRGYVVSRKGQGSKTIYDLLPQHYKRLNPVGRLDKDSSGLLLLTDDGQLAQLLTHPSKRKVKVYRVKLNKPLLVAHRRMVHTTGVMLQDGLSKLHLKIADTSGTNWIVTMNEGRNRQIRRTFAALGYNVVELHRIQFGDFVLGTLKPGGVKDITVDLG